MNYNVTLCCCFWWVGRREPCMFIAQFHRDYLVTCLFDRFRTCICYRFTDMLNCRTRKGNLSYVLEQTHFYTRA